MEGSRHRGGGIRIDCGSTMWLCGTLVMQRATRCTGGKARSTRKVVRRYLGKLVLVTLLGIRLVGVSGLRRTVQVAAAEQNSGFCEPVAGAGKSLLLRVKYWRCEICTCCISGVQDPLMDKCFVSFV
jgi:hypothetical protein